MVKGEGLDEFREFVRDEHNPEFEDVVSIMPLVDAIYMTRIQDEYLDASVDEKQAHSSFHFMKEDLQKVRAHCAILHPLPRRYEIDVVVDKDPRAAYWRQEANGMWIRVALIAYIFGVEQKIFSEFV